jgi:UDP:flavonoid glycosyltransferase YjiC (YdhE family)
MIAVALGLQRQGLRPVIATSVEYRAKVAAAGVAFAEVRPSVEQIRNDFRLSDEEIFQKVATDPAFLLRDLSMPYVRGAYEDMQPVLEGASGRLTPRVARWRPRQPAARCRPPEQPAILFSRPAIEGSASLHGNAALRIKFR